MIREIGRELEVKLAAKGCPFKVLDRESKPTTWRNAIVIDELPTTYSEPTSQSRNPKRYADESVGVRLRIYARSAKPEAMEFEHRRLARQVARLSLVALKAIRAERKIGLHLGGAEFVPIDDLAESERPGGVRFDVTHTLIFGVADLDWAGDDYPEFTFAADSITNTTEVSQGDGEEPEIIGGA